MNEFTLAIKQILEEFHLSVDERGELSASIRGKIYKEIEKFSNHKTSSNGHYLRAKLELICARKVLVNWESCKLTDNSARELLNIAEKYLQNQGDTHELENQITILYTQAENIMDEGEENFVAAYAGFACVSAAYCVLHDISFETLGIPEIEVDCDEWTASFYASTSYCGGAVWEEGVGDNLKRRIFWEWFLNDAVSSL